MFLLIGHERGDVRKQGRIILTNPDMLHVGIMPNHQSWAGLLRHLKYVVVDEAHIYRGVFGSHVACVLRRLRRLCQLYGSAPRFILCTATIANPGEHAERLAGLPFTVVANDGSPRGGGEANSGAAAAGEKLSGRHDTPAARRGIATLDQRFHWSAAYCATGHR